MLAFILPISKPKAFSDLLLFISMYDKRSFIKFFAVATWVSFKSIKLTSSFESRPNSCTVEILLPISSLSELTFKPFKNAEISSEDTWSSIGEITRSLFGKIKDPFKSFEFRVLSLLSELVASPFELFWSSYATEIKLRKSKPAFLVRELDEDPSWVEPCCERLPVFPPTIFVMLSSQRS